MRVRHLSGADADWSRVGDGEIYVSDLVDAAAAPEAAMTVGYARVGKGESMDIAFPYDEVLVVTKGAYTVRTPDGDSYTATVGQVIYLPGGTANVAVADEDAEMVYVAAPPGVYAAHVAASTAGELAE
jgi:ethanolamine utilization protein EutQ (cupin superfamily)